MTAKQLFGLAVALNVISVPFRSDAAARSDSSNATRAQTLRDGAYSRLMSQRALSFESNQGRSGGEAEFISRTREATIVAAPMFGQNVLPLEMLTAATAQTGEAANTPNTPSEKAIPWNQIGAKAGADYHGDGLSVATTEAGARLHCVFQRLDGEATAQGLWLVSTATNQPGDASSVAGLRNVDRFRVVAEAVGQQALAEQGTLTVAGQSVLFARPGLVEEYTVSVDGVRQDFVVLQKPDGTNVPASRPAGNLGPATDNELRVELAVSGAKVEPLGDGAQLVLEESGAGSRIAACARRMRPARNCRREWKPEQLEDVECRTEHGCWPWW